MRGELYGIGLLGYVEECGEIWDALEGITLRGNVEADFPDCPTRPSPRLVNVFIIRFVCKREVFFVRSDPVGQSA